ncbi:aminotransferase class V-fold PLP-dependent enzyme [Lutimonas sp.]|uniref:aminotransferase class V-fold PLP-dependent enzyme n=1 Tax=Lutimonas sp. TaxID=1872403 RepID=UPI003D9BCF11
MSLEKYFDKFRQEIIGIDETFETPFGVQKMIYADWTASGRMYRPIEEKMLHEFGPFVANTHTETTFSGSAMTLAYHEARQIIKRHVNAGPDCALIAEGTGMTGVINKFQRILGLKVSENLKDLAATIPDAKKPVVFITHMEHHSNQTSWLETIADVEIIPCDETGLVAYDSLAGLLEKYKHKEMKIASITACSNVTGIQTDYHRIAKIMHQHDGVCFVDFACSAPYVRINMNPEDEEERLDAIFFSPHKFLGGPGTSGVLIFHKSLYKNMIPDNPGGGTVNWTNPWGEHRYLEDIETREDGGTPGFLQTIRIALAVQLKEEMGIDKIHERENEIIDHIFKELMPIKNLKLLASQHSERLGVFSFYIDDLHYNLGVKLLNDRFGIQTRGGCSCAGTYGHFLLHVDQQQSHDLLEKMDQGCLIERPGWIRMSIHPTTTDAEVTFMCDAIKKLAANFEEWSKDYSYDTPSNEFLHTSFQSKEKELVHQWFNLNA